MHELRGDRDFDIIASRGAYGRAVQRVYWEWKTAIDDDDKELAVFYDAMLEAMYNGEMTA